MATFLSRLKCVLPVLAAMFLFSGCDEDIKQSMALSGQWQGDFGMYYVYEYRGREYTFDSNVTDIIFIPDYDYATHGTGKQVDYYEYGPYEYQYNYFTWEVRNGVYYLTYPYDHELDTSISNHHMTNDRFSGRFDNATSRFNLYKLEDYYDWTPYVDYYSYSSRNNWYNDYRYAPALSSESLSSDTAQGKVVRRGNRFRE